MSESITNWSVFIGVCAIVAIGIYYIFRNSSIGQLFGDIFGVLDTGAAAMDEKIKECQESGFFSTKCGIGIALILAGIGAILFGIAKFLLGPAGDTKMGELWRSVKGKGITTADMIDIKAIVDAKVQEYSEDKATADKWDDLTVEGQELFRKVVTIYETHAKAVEGLGNDPASQSKRAQLTAERNQKTRDAVAEYTDDQEPNEPDDGEDIAEEAQSIYGE